MIESISVNKLKSFRLERRAILFRLIFIVVCAFLVTTLLDQEKVIARVESLGFRWPVMIISMRVFTTIFPIFTGTPWYIASGAIFWFLDGFIYNFIGNVIGMTLSFFIARRRWSDVLYKVMDHATATKVIDLTHKFDDAKSFAITRTVLFFIDDPLNYAAGISKINYRYFLVISLVVASIASTMMIQGWTMLMWG